MGVKQSKAARICNFAVFYLYVQMSCTCPVQTSCMFWNFCFRVVMVFIREINSTKYATLILILCVGCAYICISWVLLKLKYFTIETEIFKNKKNFVSKIWQGALYYFISTQYIWQTTYTYDRQQILLQMCV